MSIFTNNRQPDFGYCGISTEEELAQRKLYHATADAVIEYLQGVGIQPDDWEALERVIATKIHDKSKQVWS